MNSFLRKSEKVQFLMKSAYKMKMRIFWKKPASSLFSIHQPLTTCQVSEQSNEQIPRKVCYRRTNERTDGRTDERTDELTGLDL